MAQVTVNIRPEALVTMVYPDGQPFPTVLIHPESCEPAIRLNPHDQKLVVIQEADIYPGLPKELIKEEGLRVTKTDPAGWQWTVNPDGTADLKLG